LTVNKEMKRKGDFVKRIGDYRLGYVMKTRSEARKSVKRQRAADRMLGLETKMKYAVKEIPKLKVFGVYWKPE